jgi:hypothetical protein
MDIFPRMNVRYLFYVKQRLCARGLIPFPHSEFGHLHTLDLAWVAWGGGWVRMRKGNLAAKNFNLTARTD